MKNARLFFAIVLLASFGSAYAQENKIVKLLNDQLQKELKLYPDSSLVLLQPFEINDRKELSVKFKTSNPNLGESDITTATVHLAKVKSLVKDINVLFETEDDAVTLVTSTTTEDGIVRPSETAHSNLFFTGISKETNNESFRDKLLAAFKKAGYKIGCTIWAD